MKSFVILVTLFLMNSDQLLAQGDGPPPDQSFWQTLVMIGIAFLFFYVILWRPEQKRRKLMEEQRDSLKKGDRVVAMGIIGTVVRVDENTVILKMYDGAKLEFYKAAITDVLADAKENGEGINEKLDAK